ncbi:MAG: (Fe-S)-binding protein [gamma proteobacterium symbiont of Phacoides pectinatus]
MSVLQRAGYRVYSSDFDANGATSDICCGRSYLAHGLVAKARTHAQQTLEVLLPHVESGRKIIGLEPSCLLAIRDDYRFLGLGEIAEKVSAQALLFEEYVAREHSAGRFKLDFDSTRIPHDKILVHGHCHQKAVGAMKAMRKLLKMIPNLDYEFVEASCCGMAGSFGLEQEHASLSLQMAEQDLFPTLRRQPDASVVANGFSCQQQILNGLGRSSLHIAQLLMQALPDKTAS